MRAVGYLLFTVSLFGCAVSLSAQAQKREPAAPRLRVATKVEKDGETSVVRIGGVAPGGLGQQLGLQVGDAIRTFKVGDERERTITNMSELSDALVKIGEATGKDKDRAVKIVIGVTSKENQKKPPVVGAVIRTDLTDKADGGSLYYFLDERVLERMKDSKSKK
jgi:hypothetical protein